MRAGYRAVRAVVETIIGNWLKRSGKRDQVLIATKVGKTWAKAVA